MDNTVFACIQCGKCTGSCPESGITPFNIRQIIRKRQFRGNVEGSIAWLCTSCGTCTIRCPRDIRPHEEVIRIRSEFVEEGNVPNSIQKALENTFVHKNPFGRARSKRAQWIEGLPFKVPHVKDTREKRLLFSCCIHAYDERCISIPRNMAFILHKARCEFGILYEEEICCGNEIKRLGEIGLFEELLEENKRIFEKYGIKEIIALSPHCMNVFKKEYGMDLKVYHYTEILLRHIENGSLSIGKIANRRFAYHDPCFLGKQNQIFEEPRIILKKVSDDLYEYSRSKENSLCCEGGGGRMFYDADFVYQRNSEKRVKEAKEQGVSTIAVSCPFCLRTIEDVAKEMEIQVMDITEILKEVCA